MGWRKAHQKCHGGLITETERTTDDNFRQHLFTYYISQNTVTWTSSQYIVTQDSSSLFNLLWKEEKNIKIIMDNPYVIFNSL